MSGWSQEIKDRNKPLNQGEMFDAQMAYCDYEMDQYKKCAERLPIEERAEFMLGGALLVMEELCRRISRRSNGTS